MRRRDIVIIIVVLLVCAAGFIAGTYLLATGQVAPAPTNGLP